MNIETNITDCRMAIISYLKGFIGSEDIKNSLDTLDIKTIYNVNHNGNSYLISAFSSKEKLDPEKMLYVLDLLLQKCDQLNAPLAAIFLLTQSGKSRLSPLDYALKFKDIRILKKYLFELGKRFDPQSPVHQTAYSTLLSNHHNNHTGNIAFFSKNIDKVRLYLNTVEQFLNSQGIPGSYFQFLKPRDKNNNFLTLSLSFSNRNFLWLYLYEAKKALNSGSPTDLKTYLNEILLSPRSSLIRGLNENNTESLLLYFNEINAALNQEKDKQKFEILKTEYLAYLCFFQKDELSPLQKLGMLNATENFLLYLNEIKSTADLANKKHRALYLNVLFHKKGGFSLLDTLLQVRNSKLLDIFFEEVESILNFADEKECIAYSNILLSSRYNILTNLLLTGSLSNLNNYLNALTRTINLKDKKERLLCLNQFFEPNISGFNPLHTACRESKGEGILCFEWINRIINLEDEEERRRYLKALIQPNMQGITLFDQVLLSRNSQVLKAYFNQINKIIRPEEKDLLRNLLIKPKGNIPRLEQVLMTKNKKMFFTYLEEIKKLLDFDQKKDRDLYLNLFLDENLPGSTLFHKLVLKNPSMIEDFLNEIESNLNWEDPQERKRYFDLLFNSNKQGFSPLHSILKKGNPDILERFLNRIKRNLKTPEEQDRYRKLLANTSDGNHHITSLFSVLGLPDDQDERAPLYSVLGQTPRLQALKIFLRETKNNLVPEQFATLLCQRNTLRMRCSPLEQAVINLSYPMVEHLVNELNLSLSPIAYLNELESVKQHISPSLYQNNNGSLLIRKFIDEKYKEALIKVKSNNDWTKHQYHNYQFFEPKPNNNNRLPNDSSIQSNSGFKNR